MKAHPIRGKAYSACYRVIGLLNVLLSLISVCAILPLIVERVTVNPSNAISLAVITLLFLLVGMLGLDWMTATVILDLEGLRCRTLRKRISLGWDELLLARTISINGTLFIVALKARGREVWVPCNDDRIRQAVAKLRIETDIKQLAEKNQN